MSCANKLNLVGQLKQKKSATKTINGPYAINPGRKESNLKVHCLVFLTSVVGNYPFEITVPRDAVVGEGFLGRSEKLLPSRPDPLHSFFSVVVGLVVSMMILKDKNNYWFLLLFEL